MSQPEPPGHDPDALDLTVVTMRFETSQPEALAAVLAKYVVLSRGHDGCRNIDLCGSVTRPGRFLVIEKWASAGARQAHFDSPVMVEMAEACRSLLTGPPDLDLFEAISAHDLR